MDLLEGWNNFLSWETHGVKAETPYPVAADLLGPLRRVHMPRGPRVYAPGGTVHAVARCNNREFYLTATEDFEVLLAPSNDPIMDGRDPRWTTQRAVGSPAFMARYAPRRRGRPKSGPMPS